MGATRLTTAAAGGVLVLGVLALPGAASAGPGAALAASRSAASTTTTCALGANGSSIKHVIYIQFDNVHYTRDQPNVPSDLQQMPNLLNFITGNGTLISREHTPLIAHTADDIVTSETGLYGSDQGVPIANEYNYYTPSGSTDTAGSFAYWTDPIVDYNTTTSAPAGDSDYTLINAQGKNTPAPWVPYTRAGCDFGSVAAADTELENTLPDIPLVYGANSAEAKEADNPKLANKAEADFMGLSVHCAQGSAICSAAHGGVADLLPDEPGGYSGYNALFGNKFIQPVISPSGPVRDLNGNVIKDPTGDVGFPGYDGLTGPVGLAYTLYMQTHGIPVTFTYLSDVHDSWVTGAGLGSGTPTYESQLQRENAAFGTFFTDLAAAGITKANTLFVITADEGDHFVGSSPAPADCNGVTITCSYRKVGEVDGNLTGMLAAHGIKHAVRRGGRLRADRLRARAAGRDVGLGPRDGADGREADRVRPGHGPDRPAGQRPGRSGGDEHPAHDHRGPEAHRHVRPVRQPGLLAEQRVGQLRQLVRQRAERTGRLEPRRRGAGDQHHVARPGRPRRGADGGQQGDLVRPHRHPAHDDGPARAAR